MCRKIILVCITFLVIISSHSQVLFSGSKYSVDVKEFERAFKKNNTDDVGKNKLAAVAEYFDLYVNFKLKLWEAYEKGYDKLPVIQTELENFREQIKESDDIDKESQLQDFQDGNIFFQFMEQEIWSKSTADSAELIALYNKNKPKYTWKQSAEAVVFFCADLVSAQSAYAQLKKDPANWRRIADSFSEKIIFDSTRYEWNQVPGLDKQTPKAGLITEPLSNTTDNTASFAYIIRVYNQPTQRSFSEARGLVINDYQQILDDKLLKSLKQKYQVKINKEVWAQYQKSIDAGTNLAKSNDRDPNNTNSLNPSKTNLVVGKYYALLIGVSNYTDSKLNLLRPVNDALEIRKTLISKYTFSDSTITVLQNPGRGKIYSELYRLRTILKLEDNLLIFFAGHGYWDEDTRQGYWWPKDASSENSSNWLSNSDLREQIRAIKSSHILLISDACFSGGIFRTRSGGGEDLNKASLDIQLTYKMPSRKAMTSGTMTTVPDESVFLQYLIKRLNNNQEKYLTSGQLFESFRVAVINNSSSVPQYGVIAETGDEGGDFIFIHR
ncbi:MAG: caspase family protein [Chitinophagaceae bacterium]